MTPDAPMALAEFEADQRIELHPATDLWMQGWRFGTVEAECLRGRRTVKLRPRDVTRVTHTADGRAV
jgi:hypothetical protein